MKDKLFREFKELAYQVAGIALSDKKKSLVAGRVAKRLRKLRIKSEEEYLEFLKNDETGEELINFLNVISTNYTFFFREKEHFEIMEEHVRHCLSLGKQRFRMWSAASSTGEEPYSIIFQLAGISGFLEKDFKLLATDISTEVLNNAKAGVYNADKVRNLTRGQIVRFFNKIRIQGSSEKLLEVKKQYKDPIIFKRLNLAKPPYPMTGPLDIIFCRNVMIYFDNAVKQRLVSEFERLLKPGGLLLIGHSESLSGLRHDLKVIKPSVYEKPL